MSNEHGGKMNRKIIIISIILVVLFSFSTFAEIETRGSEPTEGKIFKEVTLIIDKDAIIPKTYYYHSNDFSGTLYYSTYYQSHHDKNKIYVLYQGWVYSKFY